MGWTHLERILHGFWCPNKVTFFSQGIVSIDVTHHVSRCPVEIILFFTTTYPSIVVSLLILVNCWSVILSPS